MSSANEVRELRERCRQIATTHEDNAQKRERVRVREYVRRDIERIEDAARHLLADKLDAQTLAQLPRVVHGNVAELAAE